MIFTKLPPAYPRSAAFAVTCQGTSLDVAACRVSKEPINQVWPGYQRPMDQTEPAAFLSLGSDDPVTLEVTADLPFQSAVVRPLSKGVIPENRDGKLILRLPEPGQYMLELDGRHTTLAIFVDPIKPCPNGDIVFGPGVHTMTEPLSLEDGQTVVIQRGAVVYGSIRAAGKSDIAVVGEGILDNSTFARDQGTPIGFSRCRHVRVEGITVIDSSSWSMHFAGCQDVTVENIKLYGMWRYNSDGVDFTNCTDAILRNSFLRNYDDCIVIKGLTGNRDLPVRNILAEGCVLWCDWGRALEIGAETSAPAFGHIVFRNCDIIRGSAVMMDIQHGDRAEISDILFEDIRVEYTADGLAEVLQKEPGEVYVNRVEGYMPDLLHLYTTRTMYSKDTDNGSIRGVTIRDIRITSPDGRIPRSLIFAGVAGTTVSDVTLENIRVNGQPVGSLEELRVQLGEGVTNIVLQQTQQTKSAQQGGAAI